MEYRFERVVLSWPEIWLARQAGRGRRFLQTGAADALELEDAERDQQHDEQPSVTVAIDDYRRGYRRYHATADMVRGPSHHNSP